jgi:hypothetical protein
MIIHILSLLRPISIINKLSRLGGKKLTLLGLLRPFTTIYHLCSLCRTIVIFNSVVAIGLVF